LKAVAERTFIGQNKSRNPLLGAACRIVYVLTKNPDDLEAFRALPFFKDNDEQHRKIGKRRTISGWSFAIFLVPSTNSLALAFRNGLVRSRPRLMPACPRR
jgi:hypothetical protein